MTRDEAIEKVAQALFDCWKRRAARNASMLGEPAPTGRSYATDEWADLPYSFRFDFLQEAEICVDLIRGMVNPDA